MIHEERAMYQKIKSADTMNVRDSGSVRREEEKPCVGWSEQGNRVDVSRTPWLHSILMVTQQGLVQVRGTYKRPQAGMDMTYLGNRKEINLIGVENSGDWKRMRRN